MDGLSEISSRQFPGCHEIPAILAAKKTMGIKVINIHPLFQKLHRQDLRFSGLEIISKQLTG